MSYEDLDIRLGNVLKCIESFKYLLAKKHYLILTSLLLEYENDSDSSIRKYASQIRSKLVANHVCIETMLNRCEEVEKAFEITSEPVDGWTFGSDISGITTYYNVADDGLISLRVEGVLYDLPLYEQLCAIYEIGLYSKWVPFCSTSTLLKQISHVEMLAALLMSTPFGISREVVVHAYGANCLQEKNSIVIITRSVDSYDGVEIPLLSNSIFNDRCDVKSMYAVTTLLSPTTAKFACVLKLDVKFRVHQMIMNWFIKQLAGVVLPLLRKQAHYISDHPEDLLYSERFTTNAEFYIYFLLPEFRAFVQSQNWPQPSIGCLGYAGIPVKGADYSLPLYQLDKLNPQYIHSYGRDNNNSGNTMNRMSIQREISIDSTSSVLTFFSCIQDITMRNSLANNNFNNDNNDINNSDCNIINANNNNNNNNNNSSNNSNNVNNNYTNNNNESNISNYYYHPNKITSPLVDQDDYLLRPDDSDTKKLSKTKSKNSKSCCCSMCLRYMFCC